MLGYLYCVRKKDLNQTIINLVKKYFFMGTLKIESDEREDIYTDSLMSLYQDRYRAREEFFNIYKKFQSECGNIILPIKCYEVYNYHCILVEEINIDLTKINNLNFKVWRKY